MSFLCLVAPRIPGDTTSGKFAMAVSHAASGNPWLCQQLPVPVLTAQQHHTACAHLPTPKARIPCSQGSWLRHPEPQKSDKISSCVLMHHTYFPFCAASGGKKVACLISQSLSFWEWSLGCALEGVSCFGVSSCRQPRGRQELSCLHALCSTHRNPNASTLEATWRTFRAIPPRILSWAALCTFVFHTNSYTIQFWWPLLWFWCLITLCWAAYWHYRPLRLCRINK